MIGETIGNYKVLSLIGAGGMGEVYLAQQVTIDTRVAIKVLQTGISRDNEHVARFFNEAKAVSKVRHAGTVKIFDVGFHQGHAYLVMEFLEGESLAARIRRLGSLSGEMIADFGRQIAGVLDAVHAVGITHRDLKPDNIFLIPDHELPSGERVKVLDFGIAKLTGTLSGPQTKGTMGTPAYMAPEQWNNAASVDGRADTYSLGCVMFEMAVGKPPFPASSMGEACNHHLNSKPPRAGDSLPNIPAEFDTLVDRMLSKTSDSRPTIKEVARAFDEMRTSGATSRWRASAVHSVQLAATVPPSFQQPTPAPLNPTPGSFPRHHVPGMANPLMDRPSGPQAAQSSGSQLPAQSSGHQLPYLPPTTPTPQSYMPPVQGHPTTMPRGEAQPASSGSRKGLLIGGIGIAVAGAATAVVLVAKSGGSSAPAKIDGGTVASADAEVEKPPAIDAAVVVVPIEKTSREKLVETNPFAELGGVKMLARQVSVADYKLVMAKDPPMPGAAADAPIAWLTQAEATAFCKAIDARLPTSDEWTAASKGSWGIQGGGTLGPLQEWTSTIQDELVVVRGAHSKMSPDAIAKAGKQKPPYFLQKDVGDAGSDRRAVAGATIGFRCVDGTGSAAAPKPANKPAEKPANNTIGTASTGILGRLDTPKGNVAAVPTVSIGQPNAQGDLDKAIIRRYIKRNIQKIQYCYEKELLNRPGISGTVQTAFTINPDGTVTKAAGSGLSPVVANCVAEVIKTIQFPKPTGGGSVQVNYPFTFRPAGS